MATEDKLIKIIDKTVHSSQASVTQKTSGKGAIAVEIVDADGNQVTSFGGAASTYSMLVDDTTTADVMYVGLVAKGSIASTGSAIWQITKVNFASGIAYSWADGNESFDNIWNDRVSISYS